MSNIVITQAEDHINNFTFIKKEVGEFPSVTERYFTKLYRVNLPGGKYKVEKPNNATQNDICILRHSNKICIITLAPTHPILRQNKIISSVSYEISERCNRSKNAVSGKRKRGAQWLNPESPLCKITCEDGSKFTIYAGIRGNLIEVNENIIKNPTLLINKTQTEGYIGIVMVKLKENDIMANNLLSENTYNMYELEIKKEFTSLT